MTPYNTSPLSTPKDALTWHLSPISYANSQMTMSFIISQSLSSICFLVVNILALLHPSRALEKLPEVDLNFWVALASWGIGLCVDDSWAAWHHLDGWNASG